MSKHLEILSDLKHCSNEQLISLVGALCTTAEDCAYAFDITCEMTERLKEVLDDHEVPCEIVDEDF